MSARVSRRRRLPPEERSRQIIEAVTQVVAEHGVSGATVARIAAAAKVSEGTLYVYYPSRKEMLRAALDGIFTRMAALIDAAPQMSADEMLRDIARRHSEVMKTERDRFTSPWIEFVVAGPQVGLREAVTETQAKAFAKMLKIIEQGQAEGVIRDDIDAKRLTWQFYTILWAENLSTLMGLTEYIDEGHSNYSLELMLKDAAGSP
ncbi:MAG: TetR/AcrR family transcriptional regulator [Actinomycetia bacterium]|nr:TetR/AcrR family transcriptional regulator [Actinomycetes bacterium]